MKMSFVCNVVNYFNKNIILIPSVGRGLSTKFGATTKIIFKETFKIEILIWEIWENFAIISSINAVHIYTSLPTQRNETFGFCFQLSDPC